MGLEIVEKPLVTYLLEAIIIVLFSELAKGVYKKHMSARVFVPTLTVVLSTLAHNAFGKQAVPFKYVFSAMTDNPFKILKSTFNGLTEMLSTASIIFETLVILLLIPYVFKIRTLSFTLILLPSALYLFIIHVKGASSWPFICIFDAMMSFYKKLSSK